MKTAFEKGKEAGGSFAFAIVFAGFAIVNLVGLVVNGFDWITFGTMVVNACFAYYNGKKWWKLTSENN